MTASFTAALWRWPGESAWHFVTLPGDLSDEIRHAVPPGPGFGSVKVTATVGGTTWSTAVFPEAASGCYVLPVKAAVRRSEHLEAGDDVAVTLAVVGQ